MRTGLLVDRLQPVFDWHKGMVDERTGRLIYVYDPEHDVVISIDRTGDRHDDTKNHRAA